MVDGVGPDLDSKEIFPKELVTAMGELGLMGIMVPEKYGGSGLDMTAFTTAIIELGKGGSLDENGNSITAPSHLITG